jgi:hypothetical protein
MCGDAFGEWSLWCIGTTLLSMQLQFQAIRSSVYGFERILVFKSKFTENSSSVGRHEQIFGCVRITGFLFHMFHELVDVSQNLFANENCG